MTGIVRDEDDLAVFERAAEVFTVLATASRLRILNTLCHGEKCVGELVSAVALPQPSVSQHLSTLFRAGLVARRREGAQVYYKVEPKTRGFLCRAVHTLVQQQREA